MIFSLENWELPETEEKRKGREGERERYRGDWGDEGKEKRLIGAISFENIFFSDNGNLNS